MKKLLTLGALAFALSLPAGQAIASDSHSNHGSMNHGEMKSTDKKEAVAGAVINSIDEKGGKINVTHEPVPELGWPKMTMDLPVTRRVDLSKVKTGAPVNIKLKQGRDKQFRVIAIEPKHAH